MIIVQKQPYCAKLPDSGIFVEIYLPKKSVFQGTLFDTLTNGFDIQKIKSHFRNNKKKNKIRELLKNYRINDYTDEMINSFPGIFCGYSMYEVDGVFYSSDKKAYEETTQIIRLISRLELIRRGGSRYLMNPSQKLAEFKKELKSNSALAPSLFDYLRRWRDYVGLLIFGYIIYEICDRIFALCSTGQMDWNDAEDEIWVTSFDTLRINRIVFD